MNDLRVVRRLGAGLLTLTMLLAACGSAAAPPASTAPVEPSPGAPTGAPASAAPAPSDDGGGIVPGDGAKLVVPKPGQLDVRTVPADELVAAVEGSTIIVTASWTSGVEPCNVLDQVIVTQGTGAYSITLREGRGPEDVMCIAIAETHRTEIEIPDVVAGTYQITDAGGGAAPIEVTVP